MSGQIKSELERRRVRASLIVCGRMIAKLGNKTDDPEVLSWAKQTIEKSCEFLKEKTGDPNVTALKEFEVYKLIREGRTNADIAKETGVPESRIKSLR